MIIFEMVKTNTDTTIISPYSNMLVGGSINAQHQSGLVTNRTISTSPSSCSLQRTLTLQSTLQDLVRKASDRYVKMGNAVDNELIKSIVPLLLEDNKTNELICSVIKYAKRTPETEGKISPSVLFSHRSMFTISPRNFR